MREVEARLLPITRCAECKHCEAYFDAFDSARCKLTNRVLIARRHLTDGFPLDCPLETKAHNDLVKRREVFERDCRMQTERWGIITDRSYTDVWPYTKEDLTLKNRVPVYLKQRRMVWSMVRRCNGMD